MKQTFFILMIAFACIMNAQVKQAVFTDNLVAITSPELNQEQIDWMEQNFNVTLSTMNSPLYNFTLTLPIEDASNDYSSIIIGGLLGTIYDEGETLYKYIGYAPLLPTYYIYTTDLITNSISGNPNFIMILNMNDYSEVILLDISQ